MVEAGCLWFYAALPPNYITEFEIYADYLSAVLLSTPL